MRQPHSPALSCPVPAPPARPGAPRLRVLPAPGAAQSLRSAVDRTQSLGNANLVLLARESSVLLDMGKETQNQREGAFETLVPLGPNPDLKRECSPLCHGLEVHVTPGPDDEADLAVLAPVLPLCESGRRARRGVEVAAGASSNGEPRQSGNGTRAGGPEETATQYAVIAIVPVFCLMGLLGILVCNLLKRKGYHCTAHKEVGPSPGGGGSGINPAYRTEDANEDTIGVLVRLITEKKENAAALEELLKEYHSKQLVQTSHRPVPRLLPASPSMPHICPHRHHLHTVQGLASLSGSCCSRCSQKKWPEVLLSPEAAAATTPAPTLLPNPSRAPKASAKTGRQGEITILSVGRFRVARIPEQRTSSLSSEVKTITEAGPSGGDLPDSPQPGLPPEQRALLGSGGSHTKWLKPPAENKAEENRYVVRLSESNLVI
ncbi:hypothetical protein STEG23_027385 [Scotinomys teguina]